MANEPLTIEEIPADQIVIMNEYWHRAFNAAGCDPACHSCHRKIPAGVGFHLATVEQYWTKQHQRMNDEDHTHEVMLCAMCTAKGYMKKVETAQEEMAKNRTGGCFRVKGKIVV